MLDTIFDGHRIERSHVSTHRLEQLSALLLRSYYSLQNLSRFLVALADHYVEPLLVQSDVESWTNI